MKMKKLRTSFLAFALAGTCAVSAAVPAFSAETSGANAFGDVSSASWYNDAVNWAADQKVTAGKADGIFAPSDTCTRAEIVAFLYRAAGSPKVEKNEKFTDVSSNAWYSDAVAWAVRNGITFGTADTTFAPDKVCSRAEIATFLYRASGSPSVERNNTFKDVPENAYYADAVYWAVEKKITYGTSADSFSPGKKSTRAEAVTLIYRAETGSSAVKPSDPAKEEDTKEEENKKDNGGTSGGGSTGGGSASGGRSSGGNTTPSVPVRKSVIDENKSKLIDNMWAQYVVVKFDDGFNRNNTTVSVDDVDVTGSLTNVTDDGSIVKWEATSLNPAKLVVTAKSDSSATETVRLSSNANPAAPVIKDSEAPAYFMAHGPVSVFDYYLTNYDDEGNVRVKPAKTTFATAQGNDHIRSYSEDTEIDSEGNGKVEILFNYTADEDKAWFDAVPATGALELVAANEQKQTWNSNLTYTKDTADHNGSTVGRITVPIPQDNFRVNGKYYIRTKSAGHQSAMTLINVVNATAPVMDISETGSIVSGQNIHFQISNMVEGIKESIEKVTLTDPTGETTDLTYIDDWFHYGNTGLFVLYNDKNNHTKYKGKYTISIEAAGFKDFSKSFTVTEGEEVPSRAKGQSVDIMSSATAIASGTGGSGSGGSGSYAISANLVFDTDLLANALIMDKLGEDNSYASGIAARWESETAGIDYAYARDGEKLYEYTKYYNAVSDARTNENRLLTFAEYAKTATNYTTDLRPSNVKMVLEDNMLGDITSNYLGLDAPVLKLENADGVVKEGEDAVFSCEDTAYLNAITSIRKDDNAYAGISGENWSVADGKLTIKAAALRLDDSRETGDNFFTIKATGYQDTSVQIPYQKVLEDVTLKIDDGHRAGDDVVVTVDGSTGDFLKYLTLVKVNDGTTDKNVLTKSAGGDSGNDWYEIGEGGTSLTLKGGLFKHDGTYTVTVSATYYGDKTAEFTVEKAEEDPDAADAPAVTKVEKTSSWFSNDYAVSLSGDDDTIKAYINKITNVKVGEKNFSGYNIRQIGYTNGAYGTGAYLKISGIDEAVSAESDTTVEITATGYKPLTFIITKDGTLGGGGEDQPEDPEDPNEPDDPEKPSEPVSDDKEMTVSPSALTVYYDSSNKYLQLSSYNSAYTAWLGAITEVKIGEKTLTKNQYTWYASSYGINDGWMNGSTSLVVSSAALGTGDNTVVIKASGYKDVTWTISKTDGSWYSDPAFSVSAVA